MEVVVRDGQNVLDIALMMAGSIDAAFELALENNLSITDDLVAGQVITYTGGVISKRMFEYYQNNSISPATAISTEDEDDYYTRIFDKTFDYTFE